MSPQSWAEEQARSIAAEVRRLREPHSAQWLSDRTAELGHRVTRTVIADLENGRRKWVSTAELCVLARALNTVPAALLYPDPCASNVEMLPGVNTSERYALQWFSGMLDVLTTSDKIGVDQVADDAAEFAKNTERLRIAREVWDLERQKFALAFGDLGSTDQQRRKWAEAVDAVQRRIDELMARYGR